MTREMARQPSLFAALHVGSEQVSAQIMEYKSLEDMRVLDRVARQVYLGEETFKNGRISFGTVAELCDLLKGCRRMFSEYGVRGYRLLATTAIREAENQQYIIDQIQIKTGFSVEVVDMPQEIFYKYAALFKTLDQAGFTRGNNGMLFVDISSGGLGITLYQEGAIQYQQNIHIGALRIKESFEKQQKDSLHFQQALSEYIFSTIEPVQEALQHHSIQYLVLSGTETRLLLDMLGKGQEEQVTVIHPQEFRELYDQVKNLNLSQLIKKFALSEEWAEMVLPTIVLYKHILELISIEKILLPNAHFIDGMSLVYIAEKTKNPWVQMLEGQTVSLAKSLGIKYKYDAKHAACVEKTALQIFDRMSRIHGMGERERLQLQVAAILHDIGKYVSLRKHYYYSHSLIESSDIMGFSEEEKTVIANVAYYHSKGTPSNLNSNFARLSNEDKIKVAKLAAIIRLADALDRTHKQKALDCDIVLKGEELIIRVTSREDYSLEEWTFLDKADFFEDVFGVKAQLIRQVG